MACRTSDSRRSVLFDSSAISIAGIVGASFSRWFRRSIRAHNITSFSDRELCDIGVEERDIGTTVDREVGKLGIDEFRSRGWH